MSRERFDLKSPNFTRISRPVDSINTPDKTLLTTTGPKLSTFEKRSKMPPVTAFGRISREQFKRQSHQFSHEDRTL